MPNQEQGDVEDGRGATLYETTPDSSGMTGCRSLSLARRAAEPAVMLPPVTLQGCALSPTMRSPLASGRSKSNTSPIQQAICRRSWSGGATRSRLRIQAVCEVEGGVPVQVELSQGEEVQGFPLDPLPMGAMTTASFSSSGCICGLLHIGPIPPVPFGVQVCQDPQGKVYGLAGDLNFVAAEHRQRTVAAAAAEPLKAGAGMTVQGDGIVADISISDGAHTQMVVKLRSATKKELAKLAQEQALQSAMQRQRYSSLLAQIARSKMRKVDSSQIVTAEKLLRSLKLTEGTFLSHTHLSKMMRWKRVTTPSDDAADIISPCEISESCMCNSRQAQDGEVCAIVNGAVHKALEGVAPTHLGADEWFFKTLVQAALASPEGCVWKSGGKFILSNEERNQSPTAVVALLERGNPESDAGKALRALIAFTEDEYKFRVTAVQVNFHPDHTSSHKQHRDIYGSGQKGGINCTCSFMKCQGTVCYSLGSSRRVQCETMTDKSSRYEACSEECSGCKTYRYLHSGTAMFFNDKWNISHSHGIPKTEMPSGPRISVALLCA